MGEVHSAFAGKFVRVICAFALAVLMIPTAAFATAASELAGGNEAAAVQADDQPVAADEVEEIPINDQAVAADQPVGVSADVQPVADDRAEVSSADDVAQAEVSPVTDGQGSETSDTAVAATLDKDSAATVLPVVVPSEQGSEVSPQAAGIRLTKMELRKGAVGGELACDLMTDKAPVLDAGQEYYLNVTAAKDTATDDCWVSINLPWWVTPMNMVGGDNWMTPGSAVTNTALDKVIDYTPGAGASAALPSKAGTVVYHIKSTAEADVKVASFSISFKPTASYFDGDPNGQPHTSAPLVAQVGSMNGDAQGAVLDTVSTTNVTLNGSNAWGTYATYFPLTGINNMAVSSRDLSVKSAGANNVWANVEFDATYPTGATIGDVVFGGITATKGAATDNGNGTSTIHCTVIASAGSMGGSLSAQASFPSASPHDKEMKITNLKSKTWADDGAFEIPGSTNLKWYVYDGPGDISIDPGNITRFDWLGQEGIECNPLCSYATLKCAAGDPAQPLAPQTLEAQYASNLIVRAICVPLYNQHGTDIVINGTSYALADVAHSITEPTEAKPNGFAVISADKVGVDVITSCKFDVGVLSASNTTTSTPDTKDYFGDIRLSAWGNFADGNDAQSTYTIYKVGTGPTDDSAKSAVSTSHPTDDKRIAINGNRNWLINSQGKETSAVMAGEQVHFKSSYYAGPWPVQGTTTSYETTQSYYLSMPAGFKVENFKLDGVDATLVDCSADATDLPDGMKVYRVDYANPEDGRSDSYDMNLDSFSRVYEFDVTTSPYMEAGTYNMSELVHIATSPNANVHATYNGAYGYVRTDDAYGLNNNQPVASPNVAFTVQPYAGVSVTNSMQVSKNGDPMNIWMTYNDADPANTSGTVLNNFKADYKVSIKNDTEKTASEVEVYVPVPKVGQDFGSAFTPEGAQQFNLVFSADNLPAGWTAKYLKMAAGKQYNVGDYPAAGDYTEVTDPAQADMILLKGTNPIGIGESTDVIFGVSSPDNLNDYVSAVDTWGCITRYFAEGSEIIPTTTFPEQLKVSNETINGEVTKTADRTKVPVGESITYTITATNTGTFPLRNYKVTDVMPAELYYVSCTGNGALDDTTNTITWDIVELAPGAQVTYNVTANATETGEFTNKVSLTDEDGLEIDTDDETVEVGQTLVSLSKEGAQALDTIDYTITAYNDSDYPVTGVWVKDSLPEYTTFGSAEDAGAVLEHGTDDNGEYVMWFVESLGAHESVDLPLVLTLKTNIPQGVTIVNTAIMQVTGTPLVPDGDEDPDSDKGGTSASSQPINPAKEAASSTPTTSTPSAAKAATTKSAAASSSAKTGDTTKPFALVAVAGIALAAAWTARRRARR